MGRSSGQCAWNTTGVDKAILAEAVRRIVEVAHPRRVILFGSAARGDAGPDSDFDLLVVVDGPVHRRRLAQRIYTALIGVRAPVDVLVATEEDVSAGVRSPSTLISTALAEGMVVHGG